MLSVDKEVGEEKTVPVSTKWSVNEAEEDLYKIKRLQE